MNDRTNDHWHALQRGLCKDLSLDDQQALLQTGSLDVADISLQISLLPLTELVQVAIDLGPPLVHDQAAVQALMLQWNAFPEFEGHPVFGLDMDSGHVRVRMPLSLAGLLAADSPFNALKVIVDTLLDDWQEICALANLNASHEINLSLDEVQG